MVKCKVEFFVFIRKLTLVMSFTINKIFRSQKGLEIFVSSQDITTSTNWFNEMRKPLVLLNIKTKRVSQQTKNILEDSITGGYNQIFPGIW